MDELKLNRWKETFNNEIRNLQTEYNAFLKQQPLTDFYKLYIEEGMQELSLKIVEEGLPKEIKNKLMQLFTNTKPEDSI